MSRIPKYRAWHKAEKTMHPVYGVWLDSVALSGEGGSLHYVSIEEVELMQYTGLLDKAGREVYEGDIVEDVLRQPYVSDHKRRWLIYWREQFAGFYLKNMEDIDKPESKQWIDLLYGGNVEHFVVIGNIYENSDLLEPKA